MNVQVQIETPALLFSATSLILLAYTNRFLAVATIVRGLKKEYDESEDRGLVLQIHNLRRRLSLIKMMQMSGVLSLFFSVIAMFLIYVDYNMGGAITFGISLILLLLSLFLSAWEISLSTKALEIELNKLDD